MKPLFILLLYPLITAYNIALSNIINALLNGSAKLLIMYSGYNCRTVSPAVSNAQWLYLGLKIALLFILLMQARKTGGRFVAHALIWGLSLYLFLGGIITCYNSLHFSLQIPNVFFSDYMIYTASGKLFNGLYFLLPSVIGGMFILLALIRKKIPVQILCK